MKPYLRYLLAIFGCILFLSTTSCKKAFDIIKHHPDISECCRIDTITYRGACFCDPSQLNRTVFTYNQHGDPVSIEHIDIEYAADYNFYFRYDKYHRLATYKMDYRKDIGDGFLICEKFTYVNSTTIIDSNFAYGSGWPDHPVGDQGLSDVSIIKLDNQGRVISGKAGNSHYDLRGNLILGPTSKTEYDNAVSFRRTNKVWMFIDENYSMNNVKADVIGGYNSFGLPVKLKHGNHSFLYLYYDTAVFTYSCKNDNFNQKYQMEMQ